MWRFASGLLAGCCLLLMLPRLPGAVGIFLACGSGVVTALALRSAMALGLALGVAYCAWAAGERLADRLAPELEGRTLTARGSVVSVPQTVADALRLQFEPERGSGLPRRIELTWYEPEWRPLAAERLELEVRLRRPRGFANPGGTDNDARMLREGIGASGYVRSARRLGRGPAEVLRSPVLVARGAVDDATRAVLGTRPAAGIVSGLSVGLQDAVSREQWQALARSGTSHLMAISGLHIAMVATIAAGIAAAVQKWRQRRGAIGCRRDAAVFAGAVAATVYSALAGWSVPTQRTLLMIVVAALTLRLRRRIGIGDGLALCLVSVIVLDPLAPLAPGFWLSFGAVAALLFATTGYIGRPSAVSNYLRAQLAVTVGLTPVLIGSFGNVSLVAALVNLVAIPLYTLVIVPWVLLGAACIVAWPWAGTGLLHGVAWLIETTWPLIEVPSGWAFATFAVASPVALTWAALIVGSLAALAPLPVHGRVGGVALVLAACLYRPAPPEPGVVRLTVLDVGQGLAVVVQTHRRTLVYDTGPSFRSGTDAAQLAVVPFLRHRGVRAVDVLALSHADDDHAGGAAAIASSLTTRALMLSPDMPAPRWAMGPGVPRVARCRRGERWNWDGVEFQWLHPGPERHLTDNDGSCVLRVEAGGHAALLTGDVERLAEQEMLAAQVPLTAAIVVAPHHGSRSSSSPALVRATAPQWVVFAAGHRNRWGFPAPAVVERWRAVGARTLVTGTSGATEFLLRPGQAIEPPRQWRIDRRRLWTDP